MVNLIPVGEEPTGTATEDDVVEGETFSSENVEGEATGSISDRGSLSISSPGSDEPAGYYPNGISNNITDRGSIGNLDPGDYGSSGYYSSGSIEDNSPELVMFQSEYDVSQNEHEISGGRVHKLYANDNSDGGSVFITVEGEFGDQLNLYDGPYIDDGDSYTEEMSVSVEYSGSVDSFHLYMSNDGGDFELYRYDNIQ